jgi:hypothetical protein
MKRKIISLAVVLGLIAAFFVPSLAFAASLTGVADTLTDNDASATSDHDIDFTTIGALSSGDKIVISFPTGFNMGSVADADISETLQDSATITWAVAGQVVTGTLSASCSAGAQNVVIGGTNKITNPGTDGTYTITVTTKTSANVTIDSGYCLVQIGNVIGASVTVKTYISATINDRGDSGINFGAIDPGATEQPELAQGASYGAVTITVGTEVNALVKVGTYSDDWTGALSVGDVTLGTTNTYSSTAMTGSYQQVGADIAAGAGGTREAYHWMNVPDGLTAGTYTSTFYYKVDTSL